jgi:hypothetical protein
VLLCVALCGSILFLPRRDTKVSTKVHEGKTQIFKAL